MSNTRAHPSALSHSSISGGLGLLLSMRKELGKPVQAEQVRKAILQRFESRTRRFVDFAEAAYFSGPPNPVQRILRHVGCEWGDLQSLVEMEGLEGALQKLAAAGVYFRQAEFKGTEPVKRGSLEFEAGPNDFRNPLARLQVRASSSGSRGAATPVLIDLAFVRACSLSFANAMVARGGQSWRQAIWEVIGAGPRFRLLKYYGAGMMPERWFTQINPQDDAVDSLTRWSERAMRWSGHLQGVRLPAPEFAPLEAALPVVRWMRSVLDSGNIPHMLCYASAAVRLSETARSAGISLAGAELTLGGEPVTANRIRSIRESGFNVMPRYGSMETGPVAYGCLNAEAVDDVHVQQDMYGVIQQPRVDSLPDDALYLTLLHSASPFLFLNMCMGDAAVINRRPCGCPMCQFPETVRLSGIHSFDKLTAGGMTFSAASIIPILEDVLPSRFGGSSADYQLVESESSGGRPQIRILASPRAGAIDEAQLVETFLEALTQASPVNRILVAYWRDNNVVSVERRDPITTRSAKTLHLRSER